MAKKTTKKKAVSKKVSKRTTKKSTKPRTPRRADGITPDQIKILEALKQTTYGGKELTRQELKKITGIKKGYSKLLGAVTIEEFGAGSKTGLEPRGLVKSAKHEGNRSLTYSITSKGKKIIKNL